MQPDSSAGAAGLAAQCASGGPPGRSRLRTDQRQTDVDQCRQHRLLRSAAERLSYRMLSSGYELDHSRNWLVCAENPALIASPLLSLCSGRKRSAEDAGREAVIAMAANRVA